MADQTVHTFSNGSEGDRWHAQNCARCWKAHHVKGNEEAWDMTGSYCALERELWLSPLVIPLRLARRFGWSNDDAQHPDCPHRQERRPARTRRPRTVPGQTALVLP